MFGPNYGAAQSHIAELMKEREDFVAARDTLALTGAASISAQDKATAEVAVASATVQSSAEKWPV